MALALSPQSLLVRAHLCSIPSLSARSTKSLEGAPRLVGLPALLAPLLQNFVLVLGLPHRQQPAGTLDCGTRNLGKIVVGHAPQLQCVVFCRLQQNLVPNFHAEEFHRPPR